jgi:hypothetical protein
MKNLNLSKRISGITIALALITIILSSCSKYEEGPAISLMSKNARIIGVWGLTETTVNDTVISLNDFALMFANIDTAQTGGIDLSTISITDVKATLNKEGTGTFDFSYGIMGFTMSYSYPINWKFDGEKENLMLEIEAAWQDFEILRLSKDQLWIRRSEITDSTSYVTVLKFDKIQ